MEKTTADLNSNDNTAYFQINALREQRDTFKGMLERDYQDSLLSFWNYLVACGYVEEGLNGKYIINNFIRLKK